MLLGEIEDDKLYYVEKLRMYIQGKYLKSPRLQRAFCDDLKEEEGSIDYERRCYPSNNDLQVYQLAYDPPTYCIKPNFEGLKQLTHLLHLPSRTDQPYYSQFFRGELFSKSKEQDSQNLEGYSVEFFGFRLLPSEPAEYTYLPRQLFPSPSNYNCLPRFLYIDDYRLIEIYRMRVFSCPLETLNIKTSSPLSPLEPKIMYVEETWHPLCDEHKTIIGLEPKLAQKYSYKQEFIEAAFSILEYKKKPGRRTGPTNYESSQLFIEDLTQAYYFLVDSEVRRPSQDSVARELGISRTTLCRYLNFFGTSWPPVKPKG